MNFELLEHPADVGFRAWGNSVEEAFANSAHALVSIILDPSEIAVARHVALTAQGSDLESLLVNFLDEVLYYVETRSMAFSSFSVSLAEPGKVHCDAAGEPRSSQKHPARVSVKAVTYHQLRVSKVGETWIAEVFVDV